MWRLMTVLMVLSSNGGVTIATDHTDWPTEEQCIAERDGHRPPAEADINGMKLSIRRSARCVAVHPSAVAMRPQKGWDTDPLRGLPPGPWNPPQPY